jgi:hypothetical protein
MGGLQFVASLPATCTPGATASVQLSTAPFTLNYCSSTNTWQAISLAPSTSGIPANNGNIYYATNYGVKADAQAVFDGTCTNGSNVVTSATAHFQTLAKIRIGETIWVINPGAGRLSVAMTTVQSIDSDSQIHTVANGTADCSGAQNIVWGDDDTAALNAMWLHVIGDTLNCGSVVLPNAMMMISGAIMNTLPSSGNVTSPCAFGLLNPSIGGMYWQGTAFAPTPNFDLTTCSGTGKDSSCIGIGYNFLQNFNIYGFGLASTSVPGTTATIVHVHSPNMMYNVSCQNWAQADSNLSAFINDFSLAYFQFPQFFSCGGLGPSFTANAIAGPVIGGYVGGASGSGETAIVINSGAPGMDFFSNWFNGGSNDVCGLKVNGFAHFFGMPMASNSTGNEMCVPGGTATMEGGILAHAQAIAGRYALNITSGGTVYACNETFTDTGAGEFAIIIDATSTFESCGTNVYNGIINIAAGGKWIGPEADNGFCTGTATSSATLGLYGLGENATLTCTATTTNLGIPARKTGTLTGLNVTAMAAGINSSSGVVTVLKNGSATAITCTIGIGTGCNDTTHTAAVAYGDIVSVQFTTQGSETLAGVKVQVILE